MNTETARAQPHAAPSILLVDDEEDILPEYQDFLEMNGYQSAICSAPEQAAWIVSNHPGIGLVITDLRMARLDGAALIRQIRSMLPAERLVEFIILTGDTASDISDDIADVPVFTKPADTDALVSAIARALV